VTALLLKIAPWLLLIGVAYFAGCQMAENRMLEDGIRRLADVRDSLANVARGRDTLYLTQVDTFTKWRTRYDTLLKALPETLIVPGPVKAILNAADSTIRACDAVIATCEARVADRDRQIANLDSLLGIQKKRHAGDWKTKLGLLLGGAAAGVLITK
jgi:hypothetical protein